MTNYSTESFEIYNISNKGYAWGESLDSQLNEVCLGPLKCDEGDVVVAVSVSNITNPKHMGVCVDDSRWTDRYIGKMLNICTTDEKDRVVSLLQEFASNTPVEIENISSNESYFCVAGRYEFEVTSYEFEVSSYDHAWGINSDVIDGRVFLGSINVSEGDLVEALLIKNKKQTPEEVGICLSTDLWQRDYQERMVNMFADDRSAADRIINKILNLDFFECGSETVEDQENESSNHESGKVEDGDNVRTQSDEIEADLSSLRQEAEEAGTRNASRSTDTNQRPTQEYTRSLKVKEYVKTRANGVCEGCGDPAPFTSKTGEPYLHAHHLRELSEGGSDTVDSVIALCPNCHYRVHHGQDGEEYNQELTEKLEEIELNQ